jgi:hypothetical protein
MSSVFHKNLKIMKAGADLSSDQYKFVKHGATEGEVILCSVAGEAAVGVLQNAPKQGEAAEIATLGGGALLKVAGVVSAGSLIKTDANGLGVATTTDGDNAFARSFVAGVANDVVEVLCVDRQV